MATTVRIKFNSDGFRQILNSAPVAALVNSTADGIARRAGSGFEARHNLHFNYGGSPRCGASVWAATHEASRAEATTKALTRAVG